MLSSSRAKVTAGVTSKSFKSSSKNVHNTLFGKLRYSIKSFSFIRSVANSSGETGSCSSFGLTVVSEELAGITASSSDQKLGVVGRGVRGCLGSIPRSSQSVRGVKVEPRLAFLGGRLTTVFGTSHLKCSLMTFARFLPQRSSKIRQKSLAL